MLAPDGDAEHDIDRGYEKITRWEYYKDADGGAESERRDFERFATQILKIQDMVRRRSGGQRIDRAQHAKALLAVDNAKLRIADDLPEELAVGPWRAGVEFPVILRLSNASGVHQADSQRDLRGAALRIDTGSAVQDLLMTNFPVPHARDAEQFIAFASAMAGNRLLGIARLVLAVGPGEAIRMLRNVAGGTGRPVRSLAGESFWSRGAILWGESAGPVRFFLRPSPAAAAQEEGGDWPPPDNPNYLRAGMAELLAKGDVSWEFCIQRFISEKITPVEDAAAAWPEDLAEPIVVAMLTVPQQDITTLEAQAKTAEIDGLSFNPWNTTPEFRPLGNLNRARKAVYAASAAHRLRRRFHEPVPLRNRVVTACFTPAFALLNRRLPWYRLPHLVALLNLSLLRHQLRKENLIDREPVEPNPQAMQPEPAVPELFRDSRSFDGGHNDLSVPDMGREGAAFGRNLTPDPRPGDIGKPNPVLVSRDLLYRKHFIPASSLNVLAAAWIQFQVHDWVQHSRFPPGVKDIEVPMPGWMTWKNSPRGKPESVMRIAGDRPLGAGDEMNPVFGNIVSHWWDGSEIYGSSLQKAERLRDGSGPRLRLEDGYLPENNLGMEVTGFNESWWLGLSALHTMFAREHNAVCDALQREYRDWSDERVYQTARLIISALIAKIHTVEWTPAILATPEIDVALNANWSGPAGAFTRMGLWLQEAHALRGIPETLPDHHNARYCLTEDFVTVYRLHPLLPDDYRIHDAQTGVFRETLDFNAVQGIRTDEAMRRIGLSSVLYSMGIAHPGAITLHNYPRSLQSFTRTSADGKSEIIDLSVVDLVRERSRGIPRYNKFRQGLHKPPVRRWEDITADSEDVRLLREVYKSIDDVDTMVGLFAETPPPGFGFSDTAFRIFILMATRRLQSDRFLTVDFRPEIYSPLGIAWVQENTMGSIILRHFPDFASVLPTGQSAFAPWRRRQN
ncbi:peroxidase family protein [Labrenzia sp. 011]|uniref:peroxidase family protein n=1 Tax=Labrenzia sp. 011 TaxID=2171494 RepID=UPI000D52414A|nr:peroxidase family protein [Labrenzia sp. 011]PVB60099.1 peroxidase [Labrenzia sp. 011]